MTFSICFFACVLEGIFCRIWRIWAPILAHLGSIWVPFLASFEAFFQGLIFGRFLRYFLEGSADEAGSLEALESEDSSKSLNTRLPPEGGAANLRASPTAAGPSHDWRLAGPAGLAGLAGSAGLAEPADRTRQ